MPRNYFSVNLTMQDAIFLGVHFPTRRDVANYIGNVKKYGDTLRQLKNPFENV